VCGEGGEGEGEVFAVAFHRISIRL
jgi:hypothetical protein